MVTAVQMHKAAKWCSQARRSEEHAAAIECRALESEMRSDQAVLRQEAIAEKTKQQMDELRGQMTKAMRLIEIGEFDEAAFYLRRCGFEVNVKTEDRVWH